MISNRVYKVQYFLSQNEFLEVNEDLKEASKELFPLNNL